MWQDMHSRHLLRLHPALDEELARRLGRDFAVTVKERLPNLWSELRSALLRCRRGAAVESRCLEVVREQLGGKLMIAVTGGSHTAPETPTDPSRARLGLVRWLNSRWNNTCCKGAFINYVSSDFSIWDPPSPLHELTYVICERSLKS